MNDVGPTSYTSIAGPVEAVIEARRSRFLARLEPVADEAAARDDIEAARRAHHDARHHCSAFVLDPDARTQRSNDDGEPAGTAGAPMLEVLRGSGHTQVVAVVTRWFGGTLLGTGGLIRAYSGAVSAALERATPQVWRLRRRVHVEIDIAHAGRLEHELRAHDPALLQVLGVDYTASSARAARARLQLAVHPHREADVAALVASATGGAGRLARDAAGAAGHADAVLEWSPDGGVPPFR